MLAKRHGMYDKALLHGNGEVPKNGDPGSEILCVGTYGASQAEDPEPAIHASVESYSSSALWHRPGHRLCSPASQG